MIKVLLVDNHDSFTYNLAELLRSNRKIIFHIRKVESLVFEQISAYDKILISPGPGIPREHPALFRILTTYGHKKSIFGICLGMQAIASYFGGRLYNLDNVVHGQVKWIKLTSCGHRIFSSFPEQFEAGLYHSWAVSPEDFPGDLSIIALSEDGIIMGLAHQSLDICGVQFHPESIMTSFGQKILDNWVGD